MSGFKCVKVLNIRKSSLTWQGSEFAWGCNYGRVLNIPGFQVCQVSAYASVLNIHKVLNIPEYG